MATSPSFVLLDTDCIGSPTFDLYLKPKNNSRGSEASLTVEFSDKGGVDKVGRAYPDTQPPIARADSEKDIGCKPAILTHYCG